MPPAILVYSNTDLFPMAHNGLEERIKPFFSLPDTSKCYRSRRFSLQFKDAVYFLSGGFSIERCRGFHLAYFNNENKAFKTELSLLNQLYFFLLMRLREICFCCLDLNLNSVSWDLWACLVGLPCTLFRHLMNEDSFISRRMSLMTSFSLIPNCSSIASNGVLSSQAISIILSRSLSVRLSYIQHKQSIALSVH